MKSDSPVAMGHPGPPINQCDGCRVQAPLSPGGNHIMPDGGVMGCTKDRYATARGAVGLAEWSPERHKMTDDRIIKIYKDYYPQEEGSDVRYILPFARALLNAHERSLLSQVMPLLLAHELAKAPGIKQDQ